MGTIAVVFFAALPYVYAHPLKDACIAFSVKENPSGLRTALSLLIGHRKSIDLDLFTVEEFNPSWLEKYLQDKYAFRGDFREGFSLKGEVNGVKLSAIADNGTRLKDFIDVAYLSGYLSLKEMLTAFGTKYPQTTPYRAAKGLSYYDGIRFTEKIDLLGKDFNWEDITARLSAMTQEENKRFGLLDKVQKEERLQIPKRKNRGIR